MCRSGLSAQWPKIGKKKSKNERQLQNGQCSLYFKLLTDAFAELRPDSYSNVPNGAMTLYSTITMFPVCFGGRRCTTQ